MKWNILSALAQGPLAMSMIAKRVNTSIANTSQHLKILEAYGYVSKEVENKEQRTKREGTVIARAGKPKAAYSLKKEAADLSVIKKGICTRKSLDMKDEYHRTILNILLLDKSEDHCCLMKLLWGHEEFLKQCKAISFLRSDSEKIELLILTDRLEKYRKEFSNIKVKDMQGRKKAMACWSHSEEEISNGLANDDNYYQDLIKKFHVIYDPENIMEKWMK